MNGIYECLLWYSFVQLIITNAQIFRVPQCEMHFTGPAWYMFIKKMSNMKFHEYEILGQIKRKSKEFKT